jgi:hypothetical protein
LLINIAKILQIKRPKFNNHIFTKKFKYTKFIFVD